VGPIEVLVRLEVEVAAGVIIHLVHNVLDLKVVERHVGFLVESERDDEFFLAFLFEEVVGTRGLDVANVFHDRIFDVETVKVRETDYAVIRFLGSPVDLYLVFAFDFDGYHVLALRPRFNFVFVVVVKKRVGNYLVFVTEFREVEHLHILQLLVFVFVASEELKRGGAGLLSAWLAVLGDDAGGWTLQIEFLARALFVLAFRPFFLACVLPLEFDLVPDQFVCIKGVESVVGLVLLERVPEPDELVFVLLDASLVDVHGEFLLERVFVFEFDVVDVVHLHGEVALLVIIVHFLVDVLELLGTVDLLLEGLLLVVLAAVGDHVVFIAGAALLEGPQAVEHLVLVVHFVGQHLDGVRPVLFLLAPVDHLHELHVHLVALVPLVRAPQFVGVQLSLLGVLKEIV